MKFKEHFVAGAVVSAATTIAVSVVQGVSPDLTPFNSQIFSNSSNLFLSAVFIITLFMSVFPDLDTASIPQRFFYRAVLLLLIFLFIKKLIFFFIMISFLSLLPLLHKHRGWTHWKITPWGIYLVGVFMFEYFKADASWFYSLTLQNVFESLSKYWFFLLALVTGHYTHLFLDGRVKIF